MNRFNGHPLSTYAKFSYAYQGVRNVSFSENLVYVLNVWPLMSPVYLNFLNNADKMHKKRSLQLRISSVHINKSLVSCGFVTITEKIFNGKLHLFVQWSPSQHSLEFPSILLVSTGSKPSMKESNFWMNKMGLIQCV